MAARWKLPGKGNVTQNPFNSPDLSILDFYLWGLMGQAVQAQKPKNFVDRETVVCTAWSQIDMEVARKAIRDSWPKRLRKRIASNGGEFGRILYTSRRGERFRYESPRLAITV